MKFEFKCPKCGKGPALDLHERDGLLCGCDPHDHPDSEKALHGETLQNPCRNANCDNCGWGGTFPKAPKGLLPWEKKALAAGWTPPTTGKS